MVRICGFHPHDPGSIPGNGIQSYGVMVSTSDFESDNPGSNPGRTYYARVTIYNNNIPEWPKGADLRTVLVGTNTLLLPSSADRALNG